MSDTTFLASKAEEMKKKMEVQNPANNPNKTQAERARVPMTSAQRKLEVPDIPGYHLQWIYGDASRVLQARRAGFEFVHEDEVGINAFDLAGDRKEGNTDMGSRVSVIAGGLVEGDNQAARLYLMKQRKEDHDADQAITQRRNDAVADALTAAFRTGQAIPGEGPGESPDDAAARVVDRTRTKIPDLFRRKTAPKGR